VLIISDVVLGGAQVNQGTIQDVDDITANTLTAANKAVVGEQEDLEALAATLTQHPTKVTGGGAELNQATS